jgi:hypothetical protein
MRQGVLEGTRSRMNCRLKENEERISLGERASRGRQELRAVPWATGSPDGDPSARGGGLAEPPSPGQQREEKYTWKQPSSVALVTLS